ncbi:hypothetical protein EMPS_04035 [Entomortierella parvispora]|uniref:Uncharacterized protein n=1 Tax=Entomortierella parvispora TaxID=205924 RepID=A0A9P3H7U0_9FUNG|nr:hypothetical protein EMPS_04035 [Entomortierella parvispora]
MIEAKAATISGRYKRLTNSPNNVFSTSLSKTITKVVGSSRPELCAEILQYLIQQRDLHNANRQVINSELARLITEHSQPAVSSSQAPPTADQASLFTETMKLKASNMLERMFLAELPTPSPLLPHTDLIESQQKLWVFLSKMGTGDWHIATSLLPCWDPKDFEVLMTAGLKVYTATTNDPSDHHQEKLCQFSTLKENVGTRARDVSTRTQAELAQLQTSFADPGVKN